MSWITKIIDKDNVKSITAMVGLVVIVISGHINGLNGELTMAAIGILGTYAAIKKG